MQRRDSLNLLSQATLVAAVRPVLGQQTPPATTAPLQSLPPLPDIFILKKELWSPADAPFFERDAISGGAEIIQALANVAYGANSIVDDPASPIFGWQNSKLYRADHNGASPTNTRVMEPISVLAWAYTLNKPWNPYYHHPILRARLEAGLGYWLSLQSKNGGFPEDSGAGTESLPPTSFSLEFLVEMQDDLDKDGTLDPALRDRLRAAVAKGAEWAATDMEARTHGYHFSNQYCGAMFTLWRLWEITGDPKWKNFFDARLDDWLANAQPSLFWMESDAVETFAYSHVTEWELDRLYARSKNPRILESFRKYFEWCALNTLPENDGRTFLMDNVGHGRTSFNGPSGEVGYYNHITDDLPNSHAWAFKYLMSPVQREEKMKHWLQSPTPPASTHPGHPTAYHIFTGYPMAFAPHGLWTITVEQQRNAVKKLAPVAQNRFTRYFAPTVGEGHYLFARRPGVYATLHWGRPSGKQAKEVGLVWLPGFGTLLRSSNEKLEYAYCTRVGEKTTFKRPIQDFQIPTSFNAPTPDGSVQAGNLDFSTDFSDLGVHKTYRIRDNYFEISVGVKAAATEQIPLYLDSNDTVTLDGEPLQVAPTAQALQGQTLRVRRVCGGKTAFAALRFEKSVSSTLLKAYDVANGAIYTLSVDIPENQTLNYHLKLT